MTVPPQSVHTGCEDGLNRRNFVEEVGQDVPSKYVAESRENAGDLWLELPGLTRVQFRDLQRKL